LRRIAAEIYEEKLVSKRTNYKNAQVTYNRGKGTDGRKKGIQEHQER
jgi:hypothetical protein